MLPYPYHSSTASLHRNQEILGGEKGKNVAAEPSETNYWKMRPFNSRARTHNRIWQLGNQKRTSFQTETPFHSHAKTQTQDCGRHQSETNERWRDLLNAARRHILTQKSMENDGKKDHGRDGLDRISKTTWPACPSWKKLRIFIFFPRNGCIIRTW